MVMVITVVPYFLKVVSRYPTNHCIQHRAGIDTEYVTFSAAIDLSSIYLSQLCSDAQWYKNGQISLNSSQPVTLVEESASVIYIYESLSY